MDKIIKTRKGFTLVELVIVIVIVGILSVISVPIYRGYVEKAMMTEGKVLLSAIAKAELAYHVEHGYFCDTNGETDYSRELDIDSYANKYFNWFSASSGQKSYYDAGEYNDSVYIEVYGTNNNNKYWTLRAEQTANGALVGYGPNREIVEYNDEIRK